MEQKEKRTESETKNKVKTNWNDMHDPRSTMHPKHSPSDFVECSVFKLLSHSVFKSFAILHCRQDACCGILWHNMHYYGAINFVFLGMRIEENWYDSSKDFFVCVWNFSNNILIENPIYRNPKHINYEQWLIRLGWRWVYQKKNDEYGSFVAFVRIEIQICSLYFHSLL